MPYFSIILPIYNVEKYLKRCIDSILSQSFNDYELILVDDGSKDGSADICDAYEKEYSFIKTIHKENGGLSNARNAGVKIATGEYIFWIDSDDWIEQGCLEKLYSATLNTKADIVKFNYKSNPGGKISESILKPGTYDSKSITEYVVPLCLEKTTSINFSIWSHIYLHEFLKENKLEFVSERIIGSEDYLFNFQAYSSAKTILNLKDVFYVYDYRDGSLAHNTRPNLTNQYNQLQKQMVEYAKQKNIYEKYKEYLAYSYINKCFCICMRGECLQKRNIFITYSKCRRILESMEFRNAIKAFPCEKVNNVDKRNYYLMKYKLTIVLMYMLFKGINSRKKYE